jgi:hypothetical protein
MNGILLSLFFVPVQLERLTCSCKGADKFVRSESSPIVEENFFDLLKIKYTELEMTLKLKTPMKHGQNSNILQN